MVKNVDEYWRCLHVYGNWNADRTRQLDIATIGVPMDQLSSEFREKGARDL